MEIFLLSLGHRPSLRTDMSTSYPYDNPMQTDGFSFVEFAEPKNSNILKDRFLAMGFTHIATHKSKSIDLYKQNDIHFLINKEDGFASEFAELHGPSACGMGFQVKDASHAFQRAQQLGGRMVELGELSGTVELTAMFGIGDSLLYFNDDYDNANDFFHKNFNFHSVDQNTENAHLFLIDHLTHNVYQGNMDKWANFYENFFNFREIRYFHITGEQTGLLSRAMTSPCSKIRIPINEATEEKSQIAEYLREYKGEGIQHVALLTDKIIESVEYIKNNHIKFMNIPETYYEVIQNKFPELNIDLTPFKDNRILIDGEIDGDKRDILFQIFTRTVIGPIFFEIIQREGHQGFGEGNFGALFESMELDQKRRGVL